MVYFSQRIEKGYYSHERTLFCHYSQNKRQIPYINPWLPRLESISTATMPFFQASVFQSTQPDHDRRFHFKDPHNSQPGWVWGTVALPDTIGVATGEIDISYHICEAVVAGLVSWGDRAMHGLGNYCISFPIKVETPEQNLERLTDQVQDAAMWWLRLVRDKSVSIDKHMLFQARQPPPDRDDQLLDAPLHWERPKYTVPNPWSAVTVLQ